MASWGWQGERASARGPAAGLRLSFLLAAISVPVLASDAVLALWAALIVLVGVWAVGGGALWRWLRVWLPLALIYGLVLLAVTSLATTTGGGLRVDLAAARTDGWTRVGLPVTRFLVALLGIQLLQWSTPPSEVVEGLGRRLPRLALALTVALRLLPRLEQGARWRLVTAERRGLLEAPTRRGRWSRRLALWPGWFASGLEHAHDLGDAIQARGLHGAQRAVWSDRHAVRVGHAWLLVGLLLAGAVLLLPDGRSWSWAPSLFVLGAVSLASGPLLHRSRAGQASPPEPMPVAAAEPTPVSSLDVDLEIRLPTGRSLGHHQWRAEAGEQLALVGPSGCGKSSLLRVLAGVSPWQHAVTVRGRAIVAGDVERDLSEGPSSTPAACWLPQDPGRHGLGESVGRELRLTGAGPAEAHRRLAAWGVEATLDRALEACSDGEQQRALAAAHLAPTPGLWLLDEADALLDADGVTRLQTAAADHAARGGIVLIVTHDLARWSPQLDGVVAWQEEGRIGRLEDAPTVVDPVWQLAGPHPSNTAPPRPAPPTQGFTPDGRPLWHATGALDRPAGGWTVLTGDNGVGKSTLLAAWAGATECLWLPADPDRGLVGLTVADERATWTAAGLDPMRCDRLLARLGLAEVTEDDPLHDLSLGERRRLALIPLLADPPPLVLVDELDRGLDPEALTRVIEALEQTAAAGSAVVVTTHAPSTRSALLAAGADHLDLADGRLGLVSAAATSDPARAHDTAPPEAA